MAKNSFSSTIKNSLNGRDDGTETSQQQSETAAEEVKDKTEPPTAHTERDDKKKAKPTTAKKEKKKAKNKPGRPEGKTKSQITLTIKTDTIEKFKKFDETEYRRVLSKYIEMNADDILKEMETIKKYII